MDPNKELEEGRVRIRKLEEELAAWQKKAIESMPPEQLAETVQAQQMESLSYHLAKSQKVIEDLNQRLIRKDKELAEAVENIKYLESQIEAARKSVERAGAEKRQMAGELARFQEKEHIPRGLAYEAMPSDSDFDSILGVDGGGPAKPKENPKTIRDFLQLMKRINRVKLLDATILLDVDAKVVSRWAQQMADRGYLTVQGTGDQRILFATDKLLRAE